MKVKLLSCVQLLATPWTAAYQASPSTFYNTSNKYHNSNIFSVHKTKVHLPSSDTICLIYRMSSATPTLTLFLVSVMMKAKVLVTQLCLTLCDCKDCSPPGSSVHGIFQARILEWEAIPFSICYDSDF